MKTTGINYLPGRDVKETARLIRRRLGRDYSGYKFSVRLARYGMGRSIDVEIKRVPAKFGPVRCLYRGAPGNRPFTPSARELLLAIDELVDSYNRQDIDTMSDYSNVGFHSRVRFSSELRG